MLVDFKIQEAECPQAWIKLSRDRRPAERDRFEDPMLKVCKAWGQKKKDCWWNGTTQRSRDTASLESTATSMTRMISQHIGEQSTNTTEGVQTNLVDRERDESLSLIDSGAATSVCKQRLSEAICIEAAGPVGRPLDNTSPGLVPLISARENESASTCQASAKSHPKRLAWRDRSYQSD